jgi:hypothetical protein
MRVQHILILMLCTYCLAGCAPHYYHFELLEKSVSGETPQLKMINHSFIARHLPGDRVDLAQNLEIINTKNEPLEINGYSFEAISSVFTYKLTNINRNTGGLENPGAGLVLYAENKKTPSIIVKASDTLNLTIIYQLKEEISETDFKEKRIAEKVTVRMQFNELEYTYKFKAKNE